MSRMGRSVTRGVAACLALVVSQAAWAAQLIPLEPIPDPFYRNFRFTAISGDGSTVVGWQYARGGRIRPLEWRAESGTQFLFDERIGIAPHDSASDVSMNGSVILMKDGDSAIANGAYLWSAETEPTFLPRPGGPRVIYSPTLRLSGDGNTVTVGDLNAATNSAFTWSADAGYTDIGALPGATYTTMSAISSDGSIVVGSSGGLAYRWNEAFGMTPLGNLPDGRPITSARGMSPDGTFVVGSAMYESPTGATGSQAILHEDGVGVTVLGDLLGGALSATALEVSTDGGTVLGMGASADGPEPFLWTRENGMQALDDVLLALGLDTTGWDFTPIDMSADGTRILGEGTRPDGSQGGMLVIIPEPSTALLLGLGLMGISTGRRGSVSRLRGRPADR